MIEPLFYSIRKQRNETKLSIWCDTADIHNSNDLHLNIKQITYSVIWGTNKRWQNCGLNWESERESVRDNEIDLVRKHRETTGKCYQIIILLLISNNLSTNCCSEERMCMEWMLPFERFFFESDLLFWLILYTSIWNVEDLCGHLSRHTFPCTHVRARARISIHMRINTSCFTM